MANGWSTSTSCHRNDNQFFTEIDWPLSSGLLSHQVNMGRPVIFQQNVFRGIGTSCQIKMENDLSGRTIGRWISTYTTHTTSFV